MKKSIGLLALGFLFVMAPFVSAQDSREQTWLEAIKLNPKDSTAHYNLGVAYFNDSKYEAAASEFQKCVQINANDAQAKEMLESSQGFSAYSQGNYSTAANHFQSTLKVNPQNPNANLLLGDCFIHLKKFKEAEASFLNYAANTPDDPDAQKKANLGLAKVYMDQEPKDYPKAAQALASVVSNDPNNFEAYQNLGFIYFQSKDYKKAAEYWEKAVRLKKDAQIYKFLGFSYFNSGDFNNAIVNYNESIKKETAKGPKDQNINSLRETYYNLGVAYNDNGLFDEAAEAFGQAFKLDQKDVDAMIGQAQATDAAVNAHMEKASNNLMNGMYSDAISEWEKVLKFQPGNKQAQGFLEDAKNKLRDEVEKHYARGLEFYQNGDALKALTEWNTALEMDPNNGKVLTAIKKIKGKTTEQVKALLLEGDDLNRQNDFSGAKKKYNQAKKISPGSAAIQKRLKKLQLAQDAKVEKYYAKGKSYLDDGDLREAKKYLTAAQYIDSSNTQVKNALFMLQVKKGKKLDEAIEYFDSGKKDQAKEALQEVLSVEPNNKKANDYIKRITGQQSQAKVDADKTKALYYEGVSFYLDGKIHEAIEKWKECLLQDPNNIDAQNDIKKAEAKLQSIEKLNQN